MIATEPYVDRNRLRSWLQIICLIAFLVICGCYTTLRHPADVDLVTEEGQFRDCLDCHQEGSFHRYDPYSYGVHYDFYPPLWRYYYARPWWYEDYWYYVPDRYESDGSGEQRPVRRGLWSRDGPSWSIPFVGGSKAGDSGKTSVERDSSSKDTKKETVVKKARAGAEKKKEKKKPETKPKEKTDSSRQRDI